MCNSLNQHTHSPPTRLNQQTTTNISLLYFIGYSPCFFSHVIRPQRRHSRQSSHRGSRHRSEQSTPSRGTPTSRCNVRRTTPTLRQQHRLSNLSSNFDRDPIAKSLSNNENSTESNEIWCGSRSGTGLTLCKSSLLYVKRLPRYGVLKLTFRRPRFPLRPIFDRDRRRKSLSIATPLQKVSRTTKTQPNQTKFGLGVDQVQFQHCAKARRATSNGSRVIASQSRRFEDIRIANNNFNFNHLSNGGNAANQLPNPSCLLAFARRP